MPGVGSSHGSLPRAIRARGRAGPEFVRAGKARHSLRIRPPGLRWVMAISVAAPLAAGSGAANEPCPAPSRAYMVNWPKVSVTIRGVTSVRYRGERLQVTTIAAEVAVLEQLADLGALARVTAVPSADFLVAATAAGNRAVDDGQAADAGSGYPAPASAVALPTVRAGNVTLALLPG